MSDKQKFPSKPGAKSPEAVSKAFADKAAVNPYDRFFGRRAGQRLSGRKQNLMDELLPSLRPLLSDTPSLTAQDFSPKAHELWLEIGFGKGEHLAWQARENPNAIMIGCEPFRNGVAALLAQVAEQEIPNIRIHDDDARHVLDSMADASVSRLFLIHPDPWPKKRHAQRRFVNPAALDRISRVLKPGGQFRVATDHPIYLEWTLIQMAMRDDFVWGAEQPSDWRVRPDDWPATRYGEKALEGEATYLIYEKR